VIFTWFSIAALVVAGAVFYLFFYTDWRRRRAAAQPFPAQWHQLLLETMVLYRRLPGELRTKLQRLILIFLDEKRFYGCDGLSVTETMRVVIAAHACLLVLNRGMSHYDRLQSILIYPSVYRTHEEIYDLGGVYSRHPTERLGESWHEGRVILSWMDVLDDARALHPGENVTLHEFSHQLDQINGDADGLPILTQQQSIQEWAAVFEAEFRDLRENMDENEALQENEPLHEYGGENPAEFFAVATEAFFTNPGDLKQERPHLYDQLRAFYLMDPAAWPDPATSAAELGESARGQPLIH